jgi:hypothetical protein
MGFSNWDLGVVILNSTSISRSNPEQKCTYYSRTLDLLFRFNFKIASDKDLIYPTCAVYIKMVVVFTHFNFKMGNAKGILSFFFVSVSGPR